ncbi:hypothetical protein PsorP6_013104 [Peronosclerospora sorghi]|uniref:Uncharacterized protein n=1 Tax=Peronosclerospora sorghi TaxID=230839 RepID=A0ACC0WHC6_9STRA|nr:hypothetical protein PsorP6_013104 [Peronosclerospora sorghi]
MNLHFVVKLKNGPNLTDRGRAHTQIVEMVDVPLRRTTGSKISRPRSRRNTRSTAPMHHSAACRIEVIAEFTRSTSASFAPLATARSKSPSLSGVNAAKHASSDGEGRVGENAEVLEGGSWVEELLTELPARVAIVP